MNGWCSSQRKNGAALSFAFAVESAGKFGNAVPRRTRSFGTLFCVVGARFFSFVLGLKALVAVLGEQRRPS